MFILSNKIIFTADTSIGNVAAETDDEFLFKCFVDHPAFAAIKDMNNSKMFLLGGTGTGKTAFLKMIEKNEKARFIELFDLSMSHLTNSDTGLLDYIWATEAFNKGMTSSRRQDC